MAEQMKKERARRLFLIAFVLFTFANGFGGSIISNYFKGVYQVDSVQRGLFFSARIMACSRPPPPTTRIFISVLLDSTTARDEKSPQASCFLRLMMEQPDAAERHRNAVLVAGINDLLVPDGAARLHNGRYAAAAGTLDIIAEGEESITA